MRGNVTAAAAVTHNAAGSNSAPLAAVRFMLCLLGLDPSVGGSEPPTPGCKAMTADIIHFPADNRQSGAIAAVTVTL